VGAPLAIFRFLRREIPIVEIDPSHVTAPLPPADSESALRERRDGTGPVLHQVYSATMRDPKLTAGRLLAIVAADLNVIAPSEVVRFEKTRGEPGRLEEGDELLIRMAGPWNAPVKVARRWEDGFRLVARRGHPQLGELELRARDADGRIVMEIQTRERAAGLGFRLLQRLGLIRRMQAYTWAEMLENSVQLAGARPLDQITVDRRPGRARTDSQRVRAGENARRGLTGAHRLAVDAAGFAVGGVLAGLAAVRGGKAVHPHGAVYEAVLVVPGRDEALGRAELFATAATRPALVRFSRSLGLPRPLPDLLGMSVRVLDAYGVDRHQDFLMVSSVDIPVAHHIFLPARDVQQRPYSSSLPYRVGSQTLLVGAVPRADSPRIEEGNELERLAAAAATGALAFDLAVAPVWGRFRPVAELRVGDPLPPETDALRFNPWNAGGGLEPTGVLNRMRDIAYPLSQRAWGRGRRAGKQLEAETVVRRLRTSPSGGTERA